MKIIKFLHKYLIYLSLIFLAIALYKKNYLKIPPISSLFVLIESFIFLFAGFLSRAISLKQVLKKNNYHIDTKQCICGMGLSIFSKYIPGKIWMVVAPASYISQKTGFPISKLSIILLNTQFITIWIGLIFGTFGLFLLNGLHIWGLLILFLWLGLTAIIFSNFIHSSTEHLAKKIFKKDFDIPKLPIRSSISVLPWFIINWTLWSISFYLLVVSLSSRNVSLSVGLGFPLAATLGIIAIIAPGGLGAREAVMVGYFTLAGFSLSDAATIAVASRLWFLIGEVFMFAVGVMTDRFS